MKDFVDDFERESTGVEFAMNAVWRKVEEEVGGGWRAGWKC